LTNT
jgi:predicted transcriptional regulator of viral defense system